MQNYGRLGFNDFYPEVSETLEVRVLEKVRACPRLETFIYDV